MEIGHCRPHSQPFPGLSLAVSLAHARAQLVDVRLRTLDLARPKDIDIKIGA